MSFGIPPALQAALSQLSGGPNAGQLHAGGALGGIGTPTATPMVDSPDATDPLAGLGSANGGTSVYGNGGNLSGLLSAIGGNYAPGSAEDPFTRAIQASQQAQAAQLQQGRYEQSAGLYNQANQLQSSEANQLSQLQPRLGEIEAQHQLQRGDIQRQGVFQNAAANDQLAARGLSMSGIHLGSEGRFQGNQASQLSQSDLNAQQGEDAISRAITGLQTQTASNVGGINAQIGALGNVPNSYNNVSGQTMTGLPTDPIARAAALSKPTPPGAPAGTSY